MVLCKRQITSDFPHFNPYWKFVRVICLNGSKSQHFQYVLLENMKPFVFRLFLVNRPAGFYSTSVRYVYVLAKLRSL